MVLKSSLTVIEALNRASIFLNEKGFDGSLSRYYWLKYFDWDLTEYALNVNKPIPEKMALDFEKVIQRICQNEPIQYICGYEDFNNLRFKVTSDTLIPREDSFGLIEEARQYLTINPKAKVLDIGTGTGVLAVCLAKEYPDASIWASDISEKAIEIAKENARTHQVEIEFVVSDVWEDINVQDFDLVISNPPYISRDEVGLMDESVIKYEPDTALFAEESGLSIYRQILSDCRLHMKSEGLLLFEIGFKQAKGIKALVKEIIGPTPVSIKQDLNNLDRYAIIQLEKEGNNGD